MASSSENPHFLEEKDATPQRLHKSVCVPFNEANYTMLPEKPEAFRGYLKRACFAQRLRRLNEWVQHNIALESVRHTSPFEDMNGFRYHDNWLHNLMLAASRAGNPP